MSPENREQYLEDYIEHAEAPVRQYIVALERVIEHQADRIEDLQEQLRELRNCSDGNIII